MRPSSAARLHARLTYEQVAPFYDDFTAHHDYERWLPRLVNAAETCGLRGRRLLDVGCGTGKSFLPLLSRGWQVSGCDLSPSMLARAKAKARGRVRLEVADMRSLPRFGQFDLVWCIDDAVNYLLDVHELESCLRGLRRNLAPRGVVLFDVNTLRAYRTFFAETEVQDHGKWRLIWRGQAAADTPPGAQVEATFEVVPVNGRATTARWRAIHRQRHFRPEEILWASERAGLECLAVFGHGLDGHLQQPLDETRHTKAIFIVQSKREREGR
jgi:SAM-dependent methyltransferase